MKPENILLDDNGMCTPHPHTLLCSHVNLINSEAMFYFMVGGNKSVLDLIITSKNSFEEVHNV